MTLQFIGISGGFSLGLPIRSSGFVLLGVGALLLAWAWVRAAREPGRRFPLAVGWPLPGALWLATVLSVLFLRVTVPAPGGLATPGLPLQARGASLFLLAGIPWMLAAGWMGGAQASLMAFLGGSVRAGWTTHSLLTPVSAALQALVASWLLRRDYPDALGRAARQPLVASMVSGVVFGGLRCLELYAYSGGGVYDGLGYLSGLAAPTFVAALLEALAAGIGAEIARTAAPARWTRPARLAPGPHQRSLGARMVSVFVGVGLVASVFLLVGNWLLAEASARELVEREMSQLGTQAAEGVPYFIQTGRSSLNRLSSDSRGRGLSAEDLEAARTQTAFFQRLAVVDPSAHVVARAPGSEAGTLDLDLAVEAALSTTLAGVGQEVAAVRSGESPGVDIVFLVPMRDRGGEVSSALMGWTDVTTNPLLQPIQTLLESDADREAILVDETGLVLLPASSRSMGRRETIPTEGLGTLQERTAPDGTRRLVQVTEVAGYPWRVEVSLPVRSVDRLALQIAARLFGVMAAVGLLVVILVYASSRRLTRPLRSMAVAAESIARGHLDQTVPGLGEDEIGRLAGSFERMRRSLKSRLDEMDLLLGASQRLASSYVLDRVLPPILQGVQELTNSDQVRMALAADAAGRTARLAFTSGTDPGGWEALDPAILELCRQRGRFVLENPSRARTLLDLGQLSTPLEGLLALPLRSEDEFVGCLWVGYRKPHVFTPDETNLLSILAGQLGVSVANARLFLQAQVERARLGSILETTPDGVILLDDRGSVVLANPATEVLLRTTADGARGRPASEVISAPALIELLDRSGDAGGTGEVVLADGRVLFASVLAGAGEAGAPGGRICVLRDITHYKKLDMLKSEFVSTVSHDLRTPLTLMRGYGTMLSMVGPLNEQQKDFARKILDSVEHMGNLVDNLLDLGRIEAGAGLNLEKVDPAALVREVMATYSPQAANKTVALEAQIEEGMAPIDVDPTLLRQAFANLVDNAIKYTPPKGRVTVRARQTRGLQQFIVEDTGLGVAPADQPRLFERFYRARGAEARREKGSGLGLAIVKSIAEQHGGRVSLESRLGAGSVFTLEIPLTEHRRETTLDRQGS